MKKNIFIAAVFMVLLAYGCNKEEAITPSAEFSTNIESNTLSSGQGFVVYLDQTQGEFLTYFRGHRERNTYDANDPKRQGTAISNDLDSVVVAGYPAPDLATDTTYTFTMVASSSGNWAEDYLQDVKSIEITVIKQE
ncbi:MAG: hypothetical protein ACOC2E_06975 [Bacteroidota bacterium]